MSAAVLVEVVAIERARNSRNGNARFTLSIVGIGARVTAPDTSYANNVDNARVGMGRSLWAWVVFDGRDRVARFQHALADGTCIGWRGAVVVRPDWVPAPFRTEMTGQCMGATMHDGRPYGCALHEDHAGPHGFTSPAGWVSFDSVPVGWVKSDDGTMTIPSGDPDLWCEHGVRPDRVCNACTTARDIAFGAL